MTRPDGIDPRPGIVADRLRAVARVVAVAGSKGGIGKSVIAALLAQTRADQGLEVGLLDLDFTSPSAHLALGVDGGLPTETFGIDPYESAGVRLMSLAFLTGDRPTPLRGAEAGSAMLELLAITRWEELDLLIIDMPPGLGDAALDVARFLPQAEFLVVATDSRLTVASVRRAIALVADQPNPIAGVVENMRRTDGGAVARLAEEHDLRFLGAVPWDGGLEAALGDVARLRTTDAYGAVARLPLLRYEE